MSITTNKLTRIGIMAVLVVTGAVACHSNDYKTQADSTGADTGKKISADSGSKSVSNAATLPDSAAASAATTSAASGAATTTPATTAPGTTNPAANAPATTPASAGATAANPVTTAPARTTAATTTPATTVAKAKTGHGRASITMPKVFGSPEAAPQFPGGQSALDRYITNSVNYPQQAIDDDMSGVIHVSFVVDEQGKVTKAKIVDPANVGDGLDQEALRVVKGMPAWTPGKVNGKKVRTRMELPISFQVES